MIPSDVPIRLSVELSQWKRGQNIERAIGPGNYRKKEVGAPKGPQREAAKNMHLNKRPSTGPSAILESASVAAPYAMRSLLVNAREHHFEGFRVTDFYASGRLRLAPASHSAGR
jgi:hypothetical protein